MRANKPATLVAVVCLWLVSVLAGAGQKPMAPSAMREHPAIAYSKTGPSDPVAALGRRLEAGLVNLEFRPGSGYLASVLDALGISPVSQVLVFSKTSFQAPRINPKNPRAIYFNDAVAVGWVRGGEVLEFIGQDPRQGAMFYTLEQTPTGLPRLTRNFACVQCHTAADTLDVPGMFVGSVFPEATGVPLYAASYFTDHRSPFHIRWGGWYVTGRHHVDRHAGNATFVQGPDLSAAITPATTHVTSLDGRFDNSGYLSSGSDIVALMLLEHQARLLNLLTRIGWDVRLGPEASRSLAESVEEVVDYLLFVNEAPFPGPVSGSGFAEAFSATGPRDRLGRSLRQLDLQHRLLRYPCSYLIYSPSFDALPPAAKEAIYARLWRVLSGAEGGQRYAGLTESDRLAVLDILRETKSGLPPYYFAGASP